MPPTLLHMHARTDRRTIRNHNAATAAHKMGGGCTEMWQQRSHRRTQPIMLGVAKPPISGEAQMAKVRGPKGRDQENAGAWFFGEGVASTSPHHLGVWGALEAPPAGFAKRFSYILETLHGLSWNLLGAKFGGPWPPWLPLKSAYERSSRLGGHVHVRLSVPVDRGRCVELTVTTVSERRQPNDRISFTVSSHDKNTTL